MAPKCDPGKDLGFKKGVHNVSFMDDWMVFPIVLFLNLNWILKLF